MNKHPKENGQRKSLLDIVTTLSNSLNATIKRIHQPILLFIIAISLVLVIFVLTVLIISPDIPTVAYVVLMIIGILALVAMIVVSINLRQQYTNEKLKASPQQSNCELPGHREVTEFLLHNSSRQEDKDTVMTNNTYDMLFEILRSFPRYKFERLVNALLSTEELNYLPRPISIINKVEFLGYMKESGRLSDVETYLRNYYPELFN